MFSPIFSQDSSVTIENKLPARKNIKPMGRIENVQSDKSAENDSELEVELYDLEDEHSVELEEFDEDGNLVVVRDEVDL